MKKILPGLWVYVLVLPGHIPTQHLGKLPPSRSQAGIYSNFGWTSNLVGNMFDKVLQPLSVSKKANALLIPFEYFWSVLGADQFYQESWFWCKYLKEV